MALDTMKTTLTQQQLQAVNSIFRILDSELLGDADNLPEDAGSLIAEFVMLGHEERERIMLDMEGQQMIYQTVAAEHDDEVAEYVVESLHGVDVSDAWTVLLSDEQAATIPQVFNEWEVGVQYAIGKRVRYRGGLYRCIQPHLSRVEWVPETAVSLWAVILPGQDDDDWAEWVQPDSTNPYMKGDKVSHNGKHWVSDIDYNVFEPGVAGWTEVE